MPTVTFSRDYIFVPPEDRRCAVKYPAGYRGLVRKVCAEMARAAGALTDDPEIPDPAEAATEAPGPVAAPVIAPAAAAASDNEVPAHDDPRPDAGAPDLPAAQP